MKVVTSRLTIPVTERDHIRGSLTASVTLCEYGDYECPNCGEAYPVVNQLLELLGDRICFAFRNFPLTTVHPHAEAAAEAAEAAGAQHKFWQMHDTLFENQDALDDQSLVDYAKMLGENVPKFVEDLSARRYAGRVREDFMGGVHSGVNGTPTFFINGMRHDGSWDLKSLLRAVQGAIDAAD